MKKLKYILIVLLIAPVFIISCLKEDIVTDPSVSEVKMFMTDKSGKDSLITEIFEDKKIKIVVYTDANMVSVWPGGVRTILKKKNSTEDSVDMFNHPVLVASDCYIDYGLVKAKGLTTTITEGGWYAFYTYANAGAYDLTVVATNHGYNGPDLRRIIYQAGTMNVK